MIRVRLILASLFSACAIACVIGLDTGCMAADNAAAFQPPSKSEAVVHEAPEGAHILAVPAFVPNKPAWVTIVGADGQPRGQVSLLVNGVPVDSNAFGQVSFTVPNTAAMSIWLQSASGSPMDKRDYALMPDGLLAAADAAPIIVKLISGTEGVCPSLIFVPAFVEPGSNIALLGTGFEGKPQSERVVIDGLGCQVFSASADSLFVKVPDNLSVGPLKQVVVATSNGDTPVAETDAAKAALELPQAADGKGDLCGRIIVQGTDLPALVQVRIGNPRSTTIATTDGQTLADNDTIVLPGGTANFQPVTVSKKSRRSPLPTLALVSDVPQLAGDPATRTLSIVQTLDYAMLVKIERRFLALQAAWQQARKPLSAAAAAGTVIQGDKVLAEIRAISMRQNAAASMLAARKAIFLADGGSEEQYRKAMDDATGGAYYVLESKVKEMAVVPVSPLLKPVETITLAKPKPLVIPDVRFKLWPPPENTYLQTASTAPVPVAAGMQPATSQPTLRPEIKAKAPVVPTEEKQTKPQAEQAKQNAPKTAAAKTEPKGKTNGASKRMSGNKPVTNAQTRSHKRKRRRRH